MSLKWLGLIPWVIMLGGMPFLNHVEPFVMGLPLPLAFCIGCTVLSAAVLLLVYCLDFANHRPTAPAPDRHS